MGSQLRDGAWPVVSAGRRFLTLWQPPFRVSSCLDRGTRSMFRRHTCPVLARRQADGSEKAEKTADPRCTNDGSEVGTGPPPAARTAAGGGLRRRRAAAWRPTRLYAGVCFVCACNPSGTAAPPMATYRTHVDGGVRASIGDGRSHRTRRHRLQATWKLPFSLMQCWTTTAASTTAERLPGRDETCFRGRSRSRRR